MGRKGEPVVDRRIRRKSGKNQGARVHKNKYAHLAPKKKNVYDPKDKSLRLLPVQGEPGTIVQAGLIVLYHGRRYRLVEDVTISSVGESLGRFKMF